MRTDNSISSRLATTTLAMAVAGALAHDSVGQQVSIVDSKHNLSISGPGPFRATSESRICIFCHTPHRARVEAPLWNRDDSRETYMTYASSTFGGVTHQPNGGSKLCLSCHDGSIALGAVLSLDQEVAFGQGYRFLDTGDAFVGSSLIDDHPISFHYDSSDGGSGIDYVPSGAIPEPVHLDEAGLVQCTSCHDTHNNEHGNFLWASDRFGGLCLSCHAPRDWIAGSHANSNATWGGAGLDPWPFTEYDTVAENACANCHRPHNAGEPERLMAHTGEEENCLRCHTGAVAALDIAQELSKPFGHTTLTVANTHDPAENPLVMDRHSECEDCHNPHVAHAGEVPAPGVPGPTEGVSGLTSLGQPVERIRFGFELCYKCHADNHGLVVHVPRQVPQANTRREFSPNNPSYHPVEASGRNPDVPSLLPPWTVASLVECSDCHQSNSSPDAGGSGPAGPHGSIFEPLLIANYEFRSGFPESPSRYALCYRCHSRSSILNDESFDKHDKHIRGENASCAACHDSHGISSSQGNPINNTHLINFDTSVVFPNNGQMYFEDRGIRAGACTLICHGEDHDQEDYKP